MSVKVIRKNPGALEKILKRMKRTKDTVLAVGIPVGGTGASAKYPDGIPVGADLLMVAAVNNFGSPSRNIPARPFMSDAQEPMLQVTLPIAENRVPLMNKGKVTAVQILEQMGPPAVAALQETIVSFRAPANAISTVKSKGSSNPLFDTGLLKRSITYAVRSA